MALKVATVGHLLRTNGHGQMEVLLAERIKDPHKGCFIGPGGKCEPGESIIECLARELKEEIDVQIDTASAEQVAAIDFYHPTTFGLQHEWRVHFYDIRRWHGEPKPCDGTKKIVWWPFNNLHELPTPPDRESWMPLVYGTYGKLARPLKVRIEYADRGLNRVAHCTAG